MTTTASAPTRTAGTDTARTEAITPTRAPGAAVTLHPLLAQRWSSRAFDASAELAPAVLDRLLEAARWSPSAGNTQPWRFVVAARGTGAHHHVLGALAPGSRAWARHAAVLLVAVAETADEDGNPLPWALYDLGQAMAHLSTQAQAEGLVVHQMGGFSPDALSASFDLDDRLRPVVVAAVGAYDPQAVLPEPFAERELAPRSRRPLDELLVVDPEPLRRTA
jgi:nitroreductase